MAISTNTFKVNAGWAKSSIISQMESAFTFLGWQGGYETGHVVGLSSFWGGGNTGVSQVYHDVFQKSTSGIGTGASFYITRDTLGVRTIAINRLGTGYTGGELITIDSEDIGGVANGAVDLNFKVCINETVVNTTTVSIASTQLTNGAFRFTGTDRNGVVGGGQSTITIREGDILKVTNSYNNNYPAVLKNPIPYDTNVTSESAGMLAGGGPVYVGVADTYVFQSKIGQAGTYFFANTQVSGYGEMGRLVILPWNGNPVDRTTVGFGTTSTFYEKNLSYTNPWGVAKHTIQSNKRFGSTYAMFVAPDTQYTDIVTGSGWSFYSGGEYYGNTNNQNANTMNYHGGTGMRQRFAGARYLDFAGQNLSGIKDGNNTPDGNLYYTSQYNRLASINHGANTGYDLDLNIFKSGLDPNFVVFSYRNPTLSSTHIGNNTFGTWFFHKFTTNVWDLDYVFLGGLTQILYSGSTTTPKITFRTYGASIDPDNVSYMAKRSAEFGYLSYQGSNNVDYNYIDYNVDSLAYEYGSQTSDARIYYRSNDVALRYSGGSSDTTGKDRVASNVNFNAVIKGLPINGNLLPMPYYIPDDFVLINFYYNASNANIQQGDTITISPSEVYKVICGSYNQTTVTRGILFCARTV